MVDLLQSVANNQARRAGNGQGGFTELVEECLQAPSVHPGQIKAEALSRCYIAQS